MLSARQQASTHSACFPGDAPSCAPPQRRTRSSQGGATVATWQRSPRHLPQIRLIDAIHSRVRRTTRPGRTSLHEPISIKQTCKKRGRGRTIAVSRRRSAALAKGLRARTLRRAVLLIRLGALRIAVADSQCVYRMRDIACAIVVVVHRVCE